MAAPIYDRLMQYPKKNIYPFHMPGHKGGRGGAFPAIGFADITEITGFDNLHQPTGIIAQAQESAAVTFGAEESFFMVNGSTGGILAAVLSACHEGQELLIARNCHRSVYSAAALSGVTPIYIQPEFVNSTIAGGVSPEKVQSVLSEHPNISAVILTSPTYEGFTSHLKTIAEVVHQKSGRLLIVDEAHGSHMKFHTFFPKTALEQGADIVIQSMHKTLPSLTQTAILHVQGKSVNRPALKQALSMVQTSSPSYLFLASMDFCCQWLETEGKKAFSDYVEQLRLFREGMTGLNNMTLWGKELCQQASVADVDLGKLAFYSSSGKLSGEGIGRSLLEQYQLQIELSGPEHIVAMTSPVDALEGFARLRDAILDLDKRIELLESKAVLWRQKEPLLPEVYMTPRQAMNAPKEVVSWKKCQDRICGEFIIPYPPGIPLLVPGERITKSALDHILYYKAGKHNLVGCADDMLDTVTVIQK